ncbi:DUF3592 domain-containing protein [Lacrimispora sp.]|jgi:hypothetical protein|uniref:DUF3592 domain-containing protein n=1 Tax=Lacrimispora sp. TaxID=2719234 RepID=UPI0028A8CC9B|nr:hypothetical protein [Lacrimispora sp.]
MYGITFGLGFLGFFLLVIVIYSFAMFFKYRQACTMISSGIIKGIVLERLVYFPIVSYEVENKVYQVQPVYGDRHQKWQVDQKIMIFYDAKNPNIFFVEGTMPSMWIYWILSCVGVICVVLAIGFTIPSFIRGAYGLIGKSGVHFLQELSICSSLGGILAGGITVCIHWYINK